MRAIVYGSGVKTDHLATCSEAWRLVKYQCEEVTLGGVNVGLVVGVCPEVDGRL